MKKDNDIKDRDYLYYKGELYFVNKNGNVEVLDHKELNHSEGFTTDALIENSRIQKRLKTITGKVLTIIDASIADGKQKEAIKDLVKNEISMIHDLIQDEAFEDFEDNFNAQIIK